MTSYPELRDASVKGLVDMYDFMNSLDRQDIVKMAWRKCAVPGMDYNLSPKCLTSQKSQSDLNQYLLQDPDLRHKIEKHLGKIQGINNGAETELNADQYDNADVSISAVVYDELGIAISTAMDGVESTEKTQIADGELISDGLEEDIWAYDWAGNRWDDIENGTVQVLFSEDVDV
ncbi:uncharacterized protein ARMOST_15177 [Armillaria ostoyae]|uniref:Uncharacterized protein n=1 Tax=Armillaria ostoyae TaxID=47428 RepID=A0A284RSQ5_ARMOS|nr:uncharacterized protein ARMOST_15177 [Armillaria ostoyae]